MRNNGAHLKLLAGLLRLEECSASDLQAATAVAANTVKSFLRDSPHVEKVREERRDRRGRPAVIYRISAARRAALVAELTELQTAAPIPPDHDVARACGVDLLRDAVRVTERERGDEEALAQARHELDRTRDALARLAARPGGAVAATGLAIEVGALAQRLSAAEARASQDGEPWRPVLAAALEEAVQDARVLSVLCGAARPAPGLPPRHLHERLRGALSHALLSLAGTDRLSETVQGWDAGRPAAPPEPVAPEPVAPGPPAADPAANPLDLIRMRPTLVPAFRQDPAQFGSEVNAASSLTLAARENSAVEIRETLRGDLTLSEVSKQLGELMTELALNNRLRQSEALRHASPAPDDEPLPSNSSRHPHLRLVAGLAGRA